MASLAPVLKQRFFDANGDPLVGGKLYTYIAGTSTLLGTFTDAAGVTPNTNPVILDANGEAFVFLDSDSSYKFVLKDSSDVTQWTLDNVSNFADAPTAAYKWGGTAGGTANVITLTPLQTLLSYQTGNRFAFIAANSNSGATTVNISSLGAKAIKSQGGAALIGGEIVAGGIYTITYDGTNFVLADVVADNSVSKSKLTVSAKDLTVVSTVTATGTVAASTEYEPEDVSGGSITRSLPAVGTRTGRVIFLKEIGAPGANALTIDTAIDGITNRRIAAKNDRMVVVDDGTNWKLIAGGETISFRYYLPTGQPVNPANAKIDFTTKVWDYTADYSTGKFTCRVPGLYHVKGSLFLGGAFTLYIAKNGATYAQGQIATAASPSTVTSLVQMAAGDYVEIWSDTTGNTAGNNELNYFELIRVGN
jgi:hypothetical protein